MRKKRILMCRQCGKLYPHSVPHICSKCGILLCEPGGTVTRNIASVYARKRLIGWKFLEYAPRLEPVVYNPDSRKRGRKNHG